jgi:N utilization substance protein B
MGIRRKSREIALQFLFGHDFQERSNEAGSVGGELDEFCCCFETEKKALPYARTLITGICARRMEIDQHIAAHSHNWRLERMSGVDRNILRIAVFEMLCSEDVPASVAINEALELARQYSMADSISFINGILDAVLADV